MKLQTREVQEVLVLAPAGKIDSYTAPALEDALLAQVRAQGKICIDLSNVIFLSSSGLRTLVLLYRDAEQRGGHLVLAALPEVVEETMTLTGFLHFFEIYDSVKEGVAALNST